MLDTAIFENYDNETYVQFCGPAQLEKDLNILRGFISGIRLDDDINKREAESLLKWIESVRHCREKYPYKILVEKITKVLADGVVTEDESQDLLWLCDQYLNIENPYYNLITSTIQQLTGLISGIIADRTINAKEIYELNIWLQENLFLAGTWPFDDLLASVRKISMEGFITPKLHEDLLKFCDSINVISENSETNGKKLVAAISEEKVQVLIQESSFCITGASKLYTRRQIAEIVELHGGIIQDSVSGKLNYLVVCDDKNACWAFASYGRKVEKAIQLKAKGNGPMVIYEEDLFDSLMSLGFSH
ncbi:BRCT domain-containing protein [Dyadobacter psychrotolerans]|uniref:BRCT domain-containing protein n=1 Tax=Dyadobacter psychrotolerans TaxID=2541721 RepID=A0A4R5DRD2_9BACT|nr:BRCT domain-containing protein [Dyadobacter psychrotolerans]TDE14780.1 hypothetical protein E0F88_16470 [Dyadobacter psychrotolerans]